MTRICMDTSAIRANAVDKFLYCTLSLYMLFFPLKIIIDVVPNKPALLKPQTPPNTPAVSNVQKVDSRCLVKNLTFIVTVIN